MDGSAAPLTVPGCLRAAAAEIGNHAEKLVHAHVGAGLLGRFASGGGDRLFIRLELALGQHPGIVAAALDDGDPRLAAVADDNTAGGQDRRARRLSHITLISDSMACTVPSGIKCGMSRRPTYDPRTAAEKAFKTATTKPPPELLPKPPSLPGAKEMV